MNAFIVAMITSVMLTISPPEIGVSQVTTTTRLVPQAPIAVASILRRLGLPEEGLTPIEHNSEDVEDFPDISVEFTDVWYALQVALTEFLIFEQHNAWGALVLIGILGIVILGIYRISTDPPDM